MKALFLLLLLLTVNSLSVFGQPPATSGQSETGTKPPFKLPAEIKVILNVDELPGIDNPKSFWEGTYEIRLADWRTIVEKTKSGSDVAESGVVILQSSFAHRSFSPRENRTLIISIPVVGSVSDRLQQQPQNPQAFLLKSTVRLFDAQLDKNIALKVDRIWRFRLFPDGEATISIKIKPDGSSSVWGPIPKEMPPGYSIIGAPPAKKP